MVVLSGIEMPAEARAVVGDVRPNGHGHRGLFSRRAFAAGEVVGLIEGRPHAAPTQYTYQVGPGRHVEVANELRYVNHACRPNCAVSGERLVALVPIAVGEELTFDYNASEDVIAHPFVCSCCGRWIRGRLDEAGEAPYEVRP